MVTTPDAHDLEAVTGQGLTRLIAEALVQMVEAVNMVRDDAPEVLEAIERSLFPSRAARFIDIVAPLDAEFADSSEGRLSSSRPPT
jgi:prephenate dehydrogenase